MKREEERSARIIDSPVGSLYLAATDAGLTHLLFVDEMDSEPQSASGGEEAGRIVSETEQQLSEYFSGTGAPHREAARGARSRRRQRRQSDLHNCALRPRDRRGWQPDRLRRRPP